MLCAFGLSAFACDVPNVPEKEKFVDYSIYNFKVSGIGTSEIKEGDDYFETYAALYGDNGFDTYVSIYGGKTEISDKHMKFTGTVFSSYNPAEFTKSGETVLFSNPSLAGILVGAKIQDGVFIIEHNSSSRVRVEYRIFD